MKKISWLAATLLFLFAGCQGCQQHVIPQGLHELGIVLHCKKATTVASINGWPVIKIEGTREDDYMPPSATIGAILVPDSQAKDGKGKAIGTIETDIKAAGPNTTQKGAIQPNDIKTLPGGTLINYEGPKAKVFKEGQDALSFLISFLDPAREGLQPNTKYLTVVMAAALSSQKKVSQVFTSQDSCSYTTPDFSDNNPRKIEMGNATTKREIDAKGKERVKFSFDAKATALPATGAKFFLLVQADTKELYTALEALIQNDNKTADGKPLKTLTDPNAGFTPVDPAQPTLILLPRGVTTAGNGTLQVTDVEDTAFVIPKGVKYSVHGLVYEPDGTYTVSTDRSKTIEVPAAEATLTMKKVEIANFIAETDAKGQGTVHAAELSLEGSVTNQKNTVKPRTYFVFHEAATATATKKDLIEAVNKVGAQAAGLHQKNGLIIYAKAGSIAQDVDVNVTQDLHEQAFAAGVSGRLERGKTYQVYLAIKDDEGKGGTTLVGDTPMKLEVPDVAASLKTMLPQERFSKQEHRHTIKTKVHIYNLSTDMQGAQGGVLFVKHLSQVQNRLKTISNDWATTIREEQQKLLHLTHGRQEFYEIGDDGCKRFQPINATGSFTISASVKHGYSKDGFGPLLKNTKYYPVFWVWKAGKIFYTQDLTISFDTERFPHKEIWTQYGIYNGQEYEMNQDSTIIRRKKDAQILNKHTDATLITEILKHYISSDQEVKEKIANLKEPSP